MRIYLDNCCLNRPFDDCTQVRIALEAEAVSAILRLCESGAWTLIGSDALDFEAGQAPLGPRKAWLEEVLLGAGEFVPMSADIVARATELETRGLKNIDAIHVASAEAVQADIFCTCDDRLLRIARKQADLRARVASPLEIIQELEP
ncbi:MAG TPA: PIN domain-containing protein [Pirellulaceae bacterium]|nr:PIN domain-containing protein [Pirellulaceae bacterium]